MRAGTKTHWESIYKASPPDCLGWYQALPKRSLELIAASKLGQDARLIDVGGGASLLVDCLLDSGYERVTVLDLSEEAVKHARKRLGGRAELVEWLVEDVTRFTADTIYDLWHDRAVLHFLTAKHERDAAA